jgi:hypothetical protein
LLNTAKEAGVPQYVVEQFLARTNRGALAEAAEHALRAADELTSEGVGVRYLRSLYLPEDETCFHLFDGPSSEAVVEVSNRAALRRERIVEVVQIVAGDSVG